MIPLTSTQGRVLEFIPGEGKVSEKYRCSTGKIGWLHTTADEPGTTFDLTIKDALGRVKFARKGCGGATEKFGELMNIPTLLGEELQIEIDNLQGSKKLQMFLN